MRVLFSLTTFLFFSLHLLAQTDLSDLFATPTQAEIDAVITDWESRDVDVYNWQVEASTTFGGLDIDVVSHDVENDPNQTHYAFLRYPENYDPTQNYPVLIVNHGGTGGTGYGIIGGLQGCFRDFVVAAPSFRGEELRTDVLNLGTFTSDGTVSEFDRDIDDVLALLNGVLANVTGADPSRICVFGGSRGGGVSYLMSARDPRINRAVVYFGATDHITHPGYQEHIENFIDTGMGGLNPPQATVYNEAAQPYVNGLITLAEARHQLLMRSVYYFDDRLPLPLQVHHGAVDFVVEVEHSQRLAAKMNTNGIIAPDFEYFEYPTGNHGSGIDPNDERQDLICEALTLTASVEVDANCITLLPNPFTNFFVINGLTGDYTIQIIDASGMIYETLTGVNNQIEIDLTTLPAGMYFVHINNDNHSNLYVHTMLKMN